MVRRPIARSPQGATPKVPVALTRSRAEAAEQLTNRIRIGQEIANQNNGTRPPEEGIQKYKADAVKWMEFNASLLKEIFTTDELEKEYDGCSFGAKLNAGVTGNLGLFGENVREQLQKLESILDRLPIYAEPVKQSPSMHDHESLGDRSKVFVVHGHDEGARETVARFIASIGLKPIILHEQANQGRTVIEKVEAHGRVGFAVVLLTPDDLGKAKAANELNPRARQNVLLELGYFVGRLGREHVCALKRGEVEIPSDFGGVVYETFDDSGGWKQKLGRELEAVGYEIDWNKVMRS